MHSLMLSSKLAEVLIYSGKTARRFPLYRAFVSASRPLQGKEEAEQCQKVKEAAEAVKEGAQAVKETTEYIHDVASTTANRVSKMTKDVTEKVTETTDTITEKAKGSVSGVLGTAKNATDIIKKKFLGGD
ncbi:Uncharacterized protein Rs2_00448 [Raphanus sativus]|uniref:Uncharacterized protein At4g13230 n=1 Tax=Raphanus sativus TaxID=3726 RepID=A0A6J0NUJ0_RAPSA|nr:uncharacterized protein At4g13230 [Raphanus sativus]KAJ4914898.1 Uncharacterized protein Rs2_00448 [Raphanus sativus]